MGIYNHNCPLSVSQKNETVLFTESIGNGLVVLLAECSVTACSSRMVSIMHSVP